MSWLFSRRKTSVPEPTALQAQRSKQIEQLKIHNHGVSESIRDAEYRINFSTTTTNYSLVITLPVQFPHEKPVLVLTPASKHHWLNDQSEVVNCPGLTDFSVHSDLGKVVKHIVEEFQMNPPVLKTYSPLPYPVSLPATSHANNMYGATGVNPSGGAVNVSSAQPYMAQVAMPTLPPSSLNNAASLTAGPFMFTPVSADAESIGKYAMPDVPASFPQIQELSVAELQQLAEDEDKLITMIQRMPEIQKLGEDREGLCKKLEEMAESNLGKKPVLEDKKRNLLEKYDQMNDLRRRFDEQSRDQEELNSNFSVDALRIKLKVAAAEAEEDAEKVADGFLEGNLPVREFTKDYMEKRTLSHLRKAKEEKLTQHLPTT